jgi:hypothetical protein
MVENTLVVRVSGGEKLITLSIGPGRTDFHLMEWLHSLLGSLWASRVPRWNWPIPYYGMLFVHQSRECLSYAHLKNPLLTLIPAITKLLPVTSWHSAEVYRKPVKIHSHRHTAPSWTGIIRTFPPHGPSISNLATYWPSDPYCRHSRYESLDSNPYSQPSPAVSNNVQHAPGPSYHRVNIGPVCLPTPLPTAPPADSWGKPIRANHSRHVTQYRTVIPPSHTCGNTGSAVGDNDNRLWKKGQVTRGHALTPGEPDTCVEENRDRLKLGLPGRGDLQRWVVVSAVPRPVLFVRREETLLDLR